MVDWVSGYFALIGPDGEQVDPASIPSIRGHLIQRIDLASDRVVGIGFESRTIGPLQGLGFSSLKAKVCGPFVRLSGNPTGCMQGHNLFSKLGPWETIEEWSKAFLESRKLHGYRLLLDRLTRLDLTQEIDVESRDQATLTMEAMKRYWKAPRKPRSLVGEGLVYLGKRSSGWCVKAYCKGFHSTEFQGSPLDTGCFLRIEACLRTDGMKRMGINPAAPHGCDLGEVFDRVMRLCSLPHGNRVSMASKPPEGMSSALEGYWSRWMLGRPLKRELRPSTFYQVRKALMRHGVDISQPPTDLEGTLILPLSWGELCDPTRWHATRFNWEEIESARNERLSKSFRQFLNKSRRCRHAA